MKVQDLKQYYPEYYKANELYIESIDKEVLAMDVAFLEQSIRHYYKINPKVFKEADGSHPDMSIEQCNHIMGLLKLNGYKSYVGFKCGEMFPLFCYYRKDRNNEYFSPCINDRSVLRNFFPYQVWLNYLGVEPKEEFKVKATVVNIDRSGVMPIHIDGCELIEPSIESAVKSIGRDNLKAEMQDWEKEIATKKLEELSEYHVNNYISEHQKRMLAMYNPDAQSLEIGLEFKESYLVEAFENVAFARIERVEGEPLGKCIIDISLGKDKSVVSTVECLINQAEIIGQLKTKMNHINLNQFSGTSREVLNLVNELVK